MTNDASKGNPPPDSARDWESAALQRVAARHVELKDGDGAAAEPTSTRDWEQRALECLRRYFRAQR
jgi:hypothetical protein